MPPTMLASRLDNAEDPASPSPLPSSLAEILNAPILPQLANWFEEEGFHQRLAARQVLPGSHSSVPQVLRDSRSKASGSLSVASRSSMTLSRQNHGPESVVSFDHYPPSLVSNQTLTTASLNTDVASFLPGVTLLEDVGDGLLERRDPPTTQQPYFYCAFPFLCCFYGSTKEDEWRSHCLSHFVGDDPPKTVQCPLCDWTLTSTDGKIAWDERLTHVARSHHDFGESLSLARPDFALFNHLWRAKLIDNAELKELRGGSHTLAHPPAPYTVTQGREEQRRRQMHTRSAMSRRYRS